MAVFTSINGDATWGGSDIPDVSNISLSRSGDLKDYGTSDTTGGTRKRVMGWKDWSVTVEYIGGGDGITLDPGETETLVITEAGSGTGATYTGPGMVESHDVDIDIDGGEIVGGTITIQANGALVKS